MSTSTTASTSLTAATLSRRAVLGGAAGAAASVGIGMVAPKFAFASPENPSSGDVIVLVFLRGGADFLSLVAPHRMPTYRALRPTLRVKSPDEFADPAGKAGIPLVSGPNVAAFEHDDVFALMPGMESLAAQWNAGHLAIVHATGLTEIAMRSHFEAQRFWECGTHEVAVDTGWLNRYLGEVGATGNLPSVALGSELPRVLAGIEPTITLPGLNGYGLTGFADMHRATDSLQALYSSSNTDVYRTGQVALRGIDTLRRTDWQAFQPRNGAAYGEDKLSRQMRDTAAMIKAGVGLKVAQVDVWGWDWHNGSGAPESPYSWSRAAGANLSNALGAFMTDLGSDANEVTVIVGTEFGRTIGETGSGGFDHGRGSALMVLGNNVNGGVHGAFPSAITPGPEGDLAVLNDYRTVIGEVLLRRGGIDDPQRLFPAWQPRPFLNVVR
jgi:uncharacterized protein (DUF1501 family)